PALLMGDSLGDTDPSPQRMEQLPPWAAGDVSEHTKKVRAVLARFRRLAVQGSIGQALDALLASDDEPDRRVAVYLMGATDDLERLGKALTEAKHPDVWDTGVLALRHWIGRGPGQDQKLYQRLVGKRGFTPAQADTVMNLLHGFGPEDLARPE